jgi:heptosyltransferase-2
MPRLAAIPEHALQTLQRLGHVTPHVPLLGLCPGAEYGPAKRWPATYFAETAKHALAQGWEVWLFGSQKDVSVTSEINALADGKCFDLGGKTTLDEAIDLMSLTSAVISNDSGLMHIAAALDKSLVAVYGSSDPYHTPPMSEKSSIAYLGLSCSPCFKRKCPLGHLNCLRQLTPAMVMKRLDHSVAVSESGLPFHYKI